MAAEKREVGCARGIQGSRTEPEWLEMAECVDGGGIDRFVRSFSKKNAGGKTNGQGACTQIFFHREFETFFSKNLLSSNETIQTDRSKLQFQFNIPWERVRLIVSRCHSRALFSLVGNFVVNPSREP